MDNATEESTCNYVRRDGGQCQEVCHHGSPLCYWHNADIDKSEHELKNKLEAWAKTGKPMDGFQLKGVDLSNINLVRRGSKVGYSFLDADLYHANLSHSHLFSLDLRGSSLMKADLSGSNMHCANLQGCNLLGVDISRCRLENIQWGKAVLQETQAMQAFAARERQLAKNHCQEAEEVYRNIRKSCEKQGVFETAGYFFHREMVMRRYKMPRGSVSRLISKMVDLFCGYGEIPIRVVSFSMTLMLICSIAYFLLGISSAGELIGFSTSASFGDNFLVWANCLYYSVVTFTTLGYGDITPVGVSKIVAALEAFSGSFTMALFVVVFVKKMTR